MGRTMAHVLDILMNVCKMPVPGMYLTHATEAGVGVVVGGGYIGCVMGGATRHQFPTPPLPSYLSCYVEMIHDRPYWPPFPQVPGSM